MLFICEYSYPFQSPGDILLPLGLINIRWYSFLIALSLFIGTYISKRLAKSRGINPELITDFLPFLIIFSIIGARTYYVVFEWSNYTGINSFTSLSLFDVSIKIPSMFAIWKGGIAIHGALIGGFLSVIFFCRLNNISLKDLLDVITPSIILGQAIGRWGNFFNSEAFGVPTNLPWKLFICEDFRPAIYRDFNFFHPTFLYESIWNFLVFFLLIYFFNKQIKSNLLKPGFISCLYLVLYSFGRFWIEGLRIDPLCLGSTPPLCEGGLRIAQFISIILFSSGLLGIFFLNFKSNKAH